MQLVSAQQIIAQLEVAAPRTGRPVLVTDADGTLWSGDVGQDAFEALLASGDIWESARGGLAAEAEIAGIPVEGDGTAVAAAIYEAFNRHAFDEERVYEVMAWAFAGRTVEQARELAVRVQRRTGLEQRFHPEMLTIVTWALEHAIEVWVVSASPQFVVEEGVALLGIPAHRVIGAEPGVEQGRIAPRMAHRMPYGPGKTDAIRRVIGDVPILAAFGDSAFDVQMLRAADLSVAVRPKPGLRAIAERVPELVELRPPI